MIPRGSAGGRQEFDAASSDASSLLHGMALSTPAALPTQCWLPDSKTMLADGSVVDVQDPSITQGAALQGLEGNAIVNASVAMPAVLRDTTTITASHNEIVSRVELTSDHMLPAARGPSAYQPWKAGDIKPGDCVVTSNGNAVVCSVSSRTKSTIVVRIEIAEGMPVLLSSTGPGIAVYGSSPEPVYLAVLRGDMPSVDIRRVAPPQDHDVRSRAGSDPTYNRTHEEVVLRTIHPSSNCTRRGCRYFWKGKCKHGISCNGCHCEKHRKQ